ncbi:MAG: HAD family phosphatase [Clostridia bacterium]|nr:HAD family phosphatase [Clostridia bacterium]
MKAVIFDFNGTLYNDAHLHVQAWGKFLSKYFNINIPQDEIRRTFIGPSNKMIFGTIIDPNLTPEQIADLSDKKEAEYRSVATSTPENLHLVPGVEDMLNYLSENNIPFALATSSVRGNVEFYMEDLVMKKWFTWDRIVYEDSGLPHKPDPAYYIEAARILGVKPEECLIVEDSMAGIEAAKNAHAEKIVVIDNSVPEDVLKTIDGIDLIVHDFKDFRNYIC